MIAALGDSMVPVVSKVVKKGLNFHHLRNHRH